MCSLLFFYSDELPRFPPPFGTDGLPRAIDGLVCQRGEDMVAGWDDIRTSRLTGEEHKELETSKTSIQSIPVYLTPLSGQVIGAFYAKCE
eukprot:767968-Hanusia_phi.AAC.13